MYQYYYSSEENNKKVTNALSVKEKFTVEKVRVTMWEEHCLECSAPLCYKTCLNYIPRQDGRCKLFKDSINQIDCDNALLRKAARVQFRKWGNLMTVIYPRMVDLEQYEDVYSWADRTSHLLKKVVKSALPSSAKWKIIRTLEYLRRRKLRSGSEEQSDAFILHCINNKDDSFTLFLEVFDNEHNSLFKYGFNILPGENFYLLPKNKYNASCDQSGNIVKIYPENNYEADVTFLWCDFVQGKPIVAKKSSDKVKCVVWDLDNTLWDGILIEKNNSDNMNLRKDVKHIIEELDRRGIVQSIASKNDFEPAIEELKKLGIYDYFLYPQINWNPKSDSIQNIASSLNIGVDTFAFIDDSSFERNQVASVLPQVRVFSEKDVTTLLNQPCFDVIVTKDSSKRRLMYKAEEKRNSLKSASNSNIEDFIKKCQIKVNLFVPKTKEEILRCYELVLRTNQLNLSGIKYSDEEFKRVLSRNDAKTYALECRDIFGDYGIIGFIQYTVNDNVLTFTEFAMSCRVAGKYIESALFAFLLNLEKCTSGIFNVTVTEKNSLLRRTLENIGFRQVNADKKKIQYTFNADLKNCDLVSAEEI